MDPDEERRRASRITDEELVYFRRFVEREKALEEAKEERNHYWRIFTESAIRWAVPAALTALTAFLLWTGKLWVIGFLEAVRDIRP